MENSISVSRGINASSAVVWSLASDLPRMGEWSNENAGGKWVSGADGPVPGAKFRGRNRNGYHRWSTLVTVTEAASGERFAFDVSYLGIPVSAWAYEFAATDGGCIATETWTDRRPRWFTPLSRLATGVADRAEHTRASMADTLERLAGAAEQAAG